MVTASRGESATGVASYKSWQAALRTLPFSCDSAPKKRQSHCRRRLPTPMVTASRGESATGVASYKSRWLPQTGANRRRESPPTRVGKPRCGRCRFPVTRPRKNGRYCSDKAGFVTGRIAAERDVARGDGPCHPSFPHPFPTPKKRSGGRSAATWAAATSSRWRTGRVRGSPRGPAVRSGPGCIRSPRSPETGRWGRGPWRWRRT